MLKWWRSTFRASLNGGVLGRQAEVDAVNGRPMPRRPAIRAVFGVHLLRRHFAWNAAGVIADAICGE